MFLMFQQAIAKLRLKLRVLEVNNSSLAGRSTPAPTLFLMLCTSCLGVKIKDGLRNEGTAWEWVFRGEHPQPIAQVFDSTLETHSGAVKSPVLWGAWLQSFPVAPVGAVQRPWAPSGVAAEPWSGLQLAGPCRCSGILQEHVQESPRCFHCFWRTLQNLRHLF